MNTLNDSVIICDTPPKSARNKVPLHAKKVKRNARKTFYESPLKHIQLSSKRWKQRQAEQKLTSSAKQPTNNGKNSLLPEKDSSFQDSIIILSDNENELNNQDDQKDSANRTKKRKRQLETLIADKQSSKCLNDSDKSLRQLETETEICSKRRKLNSPVLSPDNNSSCLLVSDTEDSEIIPLNVDNENIAPASSSMNQTSDDVVVVWSSKKTSPYSTNHPEGEKTIAEEENDKIFMIDCNPNPANLRYLKCNKATTERSTEQNARTIDGNEISKDLPFSNRGLKLPRAHNISKSIVIRKLKRTNTFLNYRRWVSQSSIRKIPIVLTERTPDVATTFESAFKPSTSDLSRIEPSTYELSRLEPSRSKFPGPEPSGTESSKLELSRSKYHRSEPSGSQSSRLEPSGSKFSGSEPSVSESSKLEPSRPEQPGRLREIIIDGNNVAMAHKNNKTFSEEGIVLVMDYFQRRGHTVKIFIPQYRRSPFSPLLERLYTEGIVIFTPSRKIGGKRITPYDDRFILGYATVSQGIVISSDQYRDLYREKPEWRDTIEKRLLAPTFVGDYVMFPEDPLGRNGPSLDEFLRY